MQKSRGQWSHLRRGALIAALWAGAAGSAAAHRVEHRAACASLGGCANAPVARPGQLATVLSLGRPTADALDAFLQRRSAAAYNHPFVGCTSLVNDTVSHAPAAGHGGARPRDPGVRAWQAHARADRPLRSRTSPRAGLFSSTGLLWATGKSATNECRPRCATGASWTRCAGRACMSLRVKCSHARK